MDLDAKIAALLQDEKTPSSTTSANTNSSSTSASSSPVPFNVKTFGISYGLSLVAACAISFILRPQYILSFSVANNPPQHEEGEDHEGHDHEKIEVETSIKWKQFTIFSFFLSLLLCYPIYKIMITHV